MDEALQGGAIDVVGLARPLAIEPDLACALLDGTAASARPVRLATDIARLDVVIQATWYQG